MHNKKFLVIVGATATGKSKLALRIAERFNGEIINADSWAVRKYADIGTSKPSLEERSRIQHYLIDIVEPNESFSAAKYKTLAQSALEIISKKGKLPIVVGGTGLYIDALLYDYSFLPQGSEEERDELNSLSLKELQKRAQNLGLPLETVDQQNKRRVLRLIETKGGVASKKEINQNALVIGIKLANGELMANVENRTKRMIKEGLAKEVYKLSTDFGWDCETMKGIGYHEWKMYYQGTQSLEETIYRINKDTKLLAKRQITWFKRNKSIHWMTNPLNYTYIDDLITTILHKNI